MFFLTKYSTKLINEPSIVTSHALKTTRYSTKLINEPSNEPRAQNHTRDNEELIDAITQRDNEELTEVTTQRAARRDHPRGNEELTSS